MDFIRDVCQAILGLLGVVMSLKDDWAKSNKWLVISAFTILTVGAIYAGHATDRESANNLTKALEGINENSKQMLALQNKNLDLTNKNVTLQKELSEKTELEKQEQDKLRASIQAIDSKRKKEFYDPLSVLITRGKNGMNDAGSFQVTGFTQEFRDKAVEWFLKVNEFLKVACSKEAAQDFWRADPEHMEFPYDHLNNNASIAHFYRIMVEYLERLQTNNARRCDKS